MTTGQTVEQAQVAVAGEDQDGVLTVTIRGELDVTTTPALCGYLERAL